MTTIRYKNLSTGLEFTDVQHHSVCRLQSSHLESKAWQHFLDSVPDDMLYNLAIGNIVEIYDCGSRRADGMSRVIWQGVPFIRYVLVRCWRDFSMPEVLVKEQNVAKFFGHVYRSLDRRRIKYYRKHYTGGLVWLDGIYKPSRLDGRVVITEAAVA